MKSMRTLMFAGLAAAGLALAGCGSDGGPSQAELDAERERTEQQMMMVTQLQDQINALRTQLGLPADGNLGSSIQDLQDEVDRLQGEIDDAEEEKRLAAEEEARKMAAATGKALFAALGPPDTDTPPPTYALANIAAPTLSAAGLLIDAATGAGALPTADGDPDPVTLKAGDSAGSLGGWAGTNYAHTDAGTKVVNEAVVYNNKGPGKREAFADALPSGVTIATANAGGAVPAQVSDLTSAIKGYIPISADGTITTGLSFDRVMAAAFTHSGTESHAIPSTGNSFTARGTYDGAPGEYRCVTGCASTNDGTGSPSGLGGTWFFKPDAGAMVHQPDAHYLYYGWWVSKDKDGDPTAASAFVGRFGTPGDDSATDSDGLNAGWTGTYSTTAGSETITGSASYNGHAAGKWALDYSRNKAATGASNGGHFTADASLNAKFSGTGAGVSGTIDNFRLNDGTEDAGWSVALHRASFGDGGAINAPVDDTSATAPPNVDESMGTTWSIDGTSADRSGTWSGNMYDEAPGNPPGGDGSNLPTTVTGTFYSEFSDVGRMVGAFGADKQ